MKINQTIKRLWLSCAVLCAFLIQPYAQVTIENRHFRYEVESNGQNRCFTDKATGKSTSSPTPFHIAPILFVRANGTMQIGYHKKGKTSVSVSGRAV